MAYFAALLARTEDGWEASETELDAVETITDLAELARSAAVDDGTVLVFLEQEDSWFSIVRVDEEDDPRIFVSDGAAAARSSYGEVVLTDELLGRSPDDGDALAELDELAALADGGGTEEASIAGGDLDEDDAPARPSVPAGPVGDATLLEDFEITAGWLASLGPDEDALGALTEELGCGEVLQDVR